MSRTFVLRRAPTARFGPTCDCARPEAGAKVCKAARWWLDDNRASRLVVRAMLRAGHAPVACAGSWMGETSAQRNGTNASATPLLVTSRLGFSILRGRSLSASAPPARRMRREYVCHALCSLRSSGEVRPMLFLVSLWKCLTAAHVLSCFGRHGTSQRAPGACDTVAVLLSSSVAAPPPRRVSLAASRCAPHGPVRAVRLFCSAKVPEASDASAELDAAAAPSAALGSGGSGGIGEVARFL